MSCRSDLGVTPFIQCALSVGPLLPIFSMRDVRSRLKSQRWSSHPPSFMMTCTTVSLDRCNRHGHGSLTCQTLSGLFCRSAPRRSTSEINQPETTTRSWAIPVTHRPLNHHPPVPPPIKEKEETQERMKNPCIPNRNTEICPTIFSCCFVSSLKEEGTTGPLRPNP